MTRLNIILLLGLAVFIAYTGAETIQEELVRLTNEYRAENGLPAIPMSYSLTKVAVLHTLDMGNGAIQGTCNLHSWSNKGGSLWEGCCYTGDHANAACMWDKPNQITAGVFTGNGYENSASGVSTAAAALNLWKKSSGHNNVILNLDIWEGLTWRSLGASVCNGYAVLWFSDFADPDTKDPASLTCSSVTIPSVPTAPNVGGQTPSTKTASASTVAYSVMSLIFAVFVFF